MGSTTLIGAVRYTIESIDMKSLLLDSRCVHVLLAAYRLSRPHAETSIYDLFEEVIRTQEEDPIGEIARRTGLTEHAVHAHLSAAESYFRQVTDEVATRALGETDVPLSATKPMQTVVPCLPDPWNDYHDRLRKRLPNLELTIDAAISVAAFDSSASMLDDRSVVLILELSERRNAIALEETVEVLARDGIFGFKTREVANRCPEETEKSLHRQYKSRTGLIRAGLSTIAPALEKMFTQARAESSDDQTATELLTTLSTTMLQWSIRERAQVAAVFHIFMLPEKNRYGDLQRSMRHEYFQMLTFVGDRVISEFKTTRAVFNTAATYVLGAGFMYSRNWEEICQRLRVNTHDPRALEGLQSVLATSCVELVTYFIESFSHPISNKTRTPDRAASILGNPLPKAPDQQTPQRRAFLEVGRQRLAKGGIRHISARRVERKVRPVTGNINRLFGSMDNYKIEVIRSAVDEFKWRTDLAWSESCDLPVKQQLRRLCAEHVDFARRSKAAMGVLLRLHFESEDSEIAELWRSSKELRRLGPTFRDALFTISEPFSKAYCNEFGPSGKNMFEVAMLLNFYGRFIDAQFFNTLVDALSGDETIGDNAEPLLERCLVNAFSFVLCGRGKEATPQPSHP